MGLLFHASGLHFSASPSRMQFEPPFGSLGVAFLVLTLHKGAFVRARLRGHVCEGHGDLPNSKPTVCA